MNNLVPKELASLFLTKKQIQKLNILSKLEFMKVDATVMEQELGTSRRQIKELISELNEDIEENIYLVLNDGLIKFNFKVEADKYIELITNCRIKYVTESSFFQLMLFVLEKRRFSILQAAESLSYSESYVYKLINKLKQFFKQVDAGFQLEKKSEAIMQLEGCESTIRLFHYLSVVAATKGNHWLVNTITEKEIINTRQYAPTNRCEKLSPVGKNKVNFLLAIYRSALKSDHRLAPLTQDILDLGEIITDHHEINLLQTYLGEKDIGKKSSHNEPIHLLFLANYFIEELRTKDEKIQAGKQMSGFEGNGIINSCIEVIHQLQQKINFSEELQYLLLYNLCSRVIVIHYLQLYKFMPLFKFPKLNGEMDYFVESCVAKGLANYQQEPSFSKLVGSLTQIILGYLSLIFPYPQKVFVEFFHRPEYKSIIENAIETMYNANSLQVTDNYTEANIVVSDTGGYDKKYYFHFKDVFDQAAWTELGAYLNQLVSNRIIENHHLSVDDIFTSYSSKNEQ